MADDELSNEQLAAGGAVAGAAVEAAQQPGQTPAQARTAAARAARRRAQEVNIQLSEDDAKTLATAIVDEIEARGGFDAPPEPIVAPPPPPANAQPATPEQVQPPARPKSFAERFRGS